MSSSKELSKKGSKSSSENSTSNRSSTKETGRKAYSISSSDRHSTSSHSVGGEKRASASEHRSASSASVSVRGVNLHPKSSSNSHGFHNDPDHSGNISPVTTTSRDYSYYTASNANPKHVLFSGYPKMFDINAHLEPIHRRTWCRGNLRDHGECTKAHLRPLSRSRSQSKSSSSCRSAGPGTPKAITRSHSKSSQSDVKPTESPESVHSAVSSNSKNDTSVEVTARRHSRSSSSSDHDFCDRGGAYGHIPHKGYWSKQLEWDYRVPHSTPVAQACRAKLGGEFESKYLPGSEDGVNMRSPRNAYKRENMHAGRAPAPTFWGDKVPPPLPDAKDPYQHLRSLTVRTRAVPVERKIDSGPNLLIPNLSNSAENLVTQSSA